MEEFKRGTVKRHLLKSTWLRESVAPRVHRAREAARLLAQRMARRQGYELLLRHYYNPLPDLDRLALASWDRPSEMPAVDLRVKSAVDFLRDDLAPYFEEFRPPISQISDGEFFISNRFYESVDAESLYAIVRNTKPNLLVELGSGASSHVIDAARRVNASEGHPFVHEIFDPFPFSANNFGPVPTARVESLRTEDIDPKQFDRLTEGDILFVDTTHTVKTGGDVTHIFLDILPRLAPGVLVHIHDIFLPYEYPSEWIFNLRRLWAEQYLLQAFLAFNDAFEVIFPAQAVARSAPEVVAALLPSFGPEVSPGPGAFWMRRR